MHCFFKNKIWILIYSFPLLAARYIYLEPINFRPIKLFLHLNGVFLYYTYNLSFFSDTNREIFRILNAFQLWLLPLLVLVTLHLTRERLHYHDVLFPWTWVQPPTDDTRAISIFASTAPVSTEPIRCSNPVSIKRRQNVKE